MHAHSFSRVPRQLPLGGSLPSICKFQSNAFVFICCKCYVSLLLEEKVLSEAKRMRCSRRRRRYFKDVLLILSNTDASHPTPHHLLRRSFSSRRSLFISFALYLFNANVTSASFVQREVARDSVTEGLFFVKIFRRPPPLCHPERRNVV